MQALRLMGMRPTYIDGAFALSMALLLAGFGLACLHSEDALTVLQTDAGWYGAALCLLANIWSHQRPLLLIPKRPNPLVTLGNLFFSLTILCVPIVIYWGTKHLLAPHAGAVLGIVLLSVLGSISLLANYVSDQASNPFDWQFALEAQIKALSSITIIIVSVILSLWTSGAGVFGYLMACLPWLIPARYFRE